MKKCFVIVGIWPRRCAPMRVNLTLWRCATMRIQRQCATIRFHLTWWAVLDFMQSISASRRRNVENGTRFQFHHQRTDFHYSSAKPASGNVPAMMLSSICS